MPEIYLDNAATTAPLTEVINTINSTLKKNYGNPSSPHNIGLEAEKTLKKARQILASAINVNPGEIFFTSGGTESNNWAIRKAADYYSRYGDHLITTMIEHPSVLKTYQDLEKKGFKVTYLPVNKNGTLAPETLEKVITSETILISTMFVNNEIGSILPVNELAVIINNLKNDRNKKNRSYPVFHVDAVQALGKIPFNLNELDVDLMSLSAHKLHGPKGTGALYKRKKLILPPFITGGEQENSFRSGTENVPGIAGFGQAVKLAIKNLKHNRQQMQKLKLKLIKGLRNNIQNIFINGPQPENAVPHIVNISFPGLKGEVLVNALSDKGIYVTTRSACSTHKNTPSHVLQALKLSNSHLDNAIRISLSSQTSSADIDYVIEKLPETVKQLRKIMGGV